LKVRTTNTAGWTCNTAANSCTTPDAGFNEIRVKDINNNSILARIFVTSKWSIYAYPQPYSASISTDGTTVTAAAGVDPNAASYTWTLTPSSDTDKDGAGIVHSNPNTPTIVVNADGNSYMFTCVCRLHLIQK
jgi:hypothetical protein